MKKRDFEVFLVFPPGPFAQKIRSLGEIGIRTFELPIRTNFFKSVKEVKKLIRSYKIDYVHSHQMRADAIAVLSTLFIKDVKLASSVHCIIKYDIQSPIKRFIYYIPSFLNYRLIDIIFAVSSGSKEILKKYYYLKSSKIVITLNSIDFKEIKPNKDNQKKIKSQFNLSTNDKLVLCAGAFTHLKGQEFLIKAFSRLKESQDLKLILLGIGELQNKLKKLIVELGLESKVLMPGYREDIYDWMSISTLYIQPSIFESLSRALLEAMYLGLPVISSDIVTVKDVIKDGDTGFLSPLNEVSIASEIKKILKNDELRIKVAKSGRDFVIRNCSIENMVETIICYLNDE